MDVVMEPDAVRHARLRLASPEVVSADLRAYAEKRSDRLPSGDDEDLESLLAARAEPLIDLALAQYATSSSVVAGLFAAGLEKGSGGGDSVHRKGLRVACYANQQLDTFLSEGLLSRLASEEVIAEILAAGELGELLVLLRNPAIGDKELAALYRKSGPFERLEEGRWRQLIDLASANPRIVAAGDEEHGPDWGFWEIHKGLFELVTTAPPTREWCRTLHRTLIAVHPPSVVIKEPINPTLEKWKDVEVLNYKGEPAEGEFTQLTLADEFRCLLASVYGTRFVDSRYEHAGAADSPDLAERCAYYAGAKLTAKDVVRFAKTDGDAFGLAFLFNERAILDREARDAFEERASFSSWLYRSRVKVVARKWTFLGKVLARFDGEEDVNPDDASRATLDQLVAQFSRLDKQLRYIGYGLAVVIMVIAFRLWR